MGFSALAIWTTMWMMKYYYGPCAWTSRVKLSLLVTFNAGADGDEHLPRIMLLPFCSPWSTSRRGLKAIVIEIATANELGLIQTHLTQKQVVRVEAGKGAKVLVWALPLDWRLNKYLPLLSAPKQTTNNRDLEITAQSQSCPLSGRKKKKGLVRGYHLLSYLCS
jgi:hypothetical protein